MAVGAPCERNQGDKSQRPYEHEPAGGPAEFRSRIDCADYGRPAENGCDQATGYHTRRSSLPRNEEVGDALYAPCTADCYSDQNNEIYAEYDVHRAQR